MSELDTGLAELRDDLRAAMRRPDLGHVATRARQQRMRRRAQIGAIVAVVLVIVTVPLLRSVSDDHRPAAPPHHEYKPARVPDYTMDFADADHGYALRSACDGPCTFALFASTDGGTQWERRELPKGDRKYLKGELTVLGPDTLQFLRFLSGAMGSTESYLSTDGGRTWLWSNPRGPTAPAAIPPEAILQQTCILSGNGDECPIALAMQMPDGKLLSPVLTQPPLREPRPGVVATSGGRFWATGQEPASGKWAVSVTSDAGATWATNLLDVPGTPATGDAWSVVEHGGVMYATVTGALENGPSELLAVFRSTDAGVSWTRTWPSSSKTRLLNVTGDAIATSDGRLIVRTSADGPFESSDGGRTFTPSSLRLLGTVTWTRGGYLARHPENEWDISQDGVTWRTFVLY
jgi:hypothetical protein